MSVDELTAAVEYRQPQGFENYRFGSDGSVQTRHGGSRLACVPWRNLKQHDAGRGYKQVVLYRDKKPHVKTVHRMILELFVGPCPPGMEACHNNGVPSDNRVSNLRWDTKVNNQADKRLHGTHLWGSTHPNAKLTERDIPVIRGMYRLGFIQKQIAEEFGVLQPLISAIILGNSWSHVPDSDAVEVGSTSGCG